MIRDDCALFCDEKFLRDNCDSGINAHAYGDGNVIRRHANSVYLQNYFRRDDNDDGDSVCPFKLNHASEGLLILYFGDEIL